ncbi:MAG: hypothetical protein NTX73_13225 [Rhodobacterales bacterium]|jgi:hypothetical protein|nr:hypothetical protein [Rhodobacterales bacterium]
MTARNLVLISVIFEVLVGITLIALPQVVANGFLAAQFDPNGLAIARLAGIALLSFGITGWIGRESRPAFVGLLTYNVLAAVYILFLGLTLPATGPLLWPAGAAHAVLAVLMAIRLGDAGR